MNSEIQNVSNDHSAQLLSGGPLSIENVNNVKTQGKFNTNVNAGITAFKASELQTFLKFPTVVFAGSVASSTPRGANIYATAVSPVLIKSSSKTRIASFAQNFKQWCGSMHIRAIFTKPIFVQTKILAAFIPGFDIANVANLTIDDCYAAQYHALFNPDNDNELSFVLPFITGVNWLNMNESSGVFVLKLFQPLIASQPTGVVDVNIPFTITISSTTDDGLMPLDFRYLIAPTFDNTPSTNNAVNILIGNFAPELTSNIKPVAPISGYQKEFKTALFAPKSSLSNIIDQHNGIAPALGVTKNYNAFVEDDFAFSNLNGDILLPNSENKIYEMPTFINLALLTNLLNESALVYNIVPNLSKTQLLSHYSTYTSLVTNRRLDVQIYTLFDNGMNQGTAYTYNGPIAIHAQISQNLRYYYVFTKVTVFKFAIDEALFAYTMYYSDLQPNEDYQTSWDTAQILDGIGFPGVYINSGQIDDNYAPLQHALIDNADPASTHVLLYSEQNRFDLARQFEFGNYTNINLSTVNEFAAGQSARAAFETAAAQSAILDDLVQIDPIALVAAVKYGADLVAKVSRFVSSFCSWILPFISTGSRNVSANDFVLFDIAAGTKFTFINSQLSSTPAIVNNDISVLRYNSSTTLSTNIFQD